MIVNIEGKEHEFYVGDTIVTDKGRHLLVVDATDYSLKDCEILPVRFLLIDIKRGTLFGYEEEFWYIPENYNIVDVIPNENSWARR